MNEGRFTLIVAVSSYVNLEHIYKGSYETNVVNSINDHMVFSLKLEIIKPLKV